MSHSRHLKVIHQFVILAGVIHYSSPECINTYGYTKSNSYSQISILECDNVANYAETISYYRTQFGFSMIHIYNSIIGVIQPGSFRYFNDLLQLWMPNNDINILEPGSFNGLSNIEELNLTNNNIETISKGVFSGMYSLSTLDVSHNQIQTIANNSFARTDNLKTLHLNNNNIETISKGIFNGKSKLWLLDLSHNQIQPIANDSFTGTDSLKTLYLNNNNIETISKGIFNGMHELWLLDLSHNQIQTIANNSFIGTDSLSTLYLNDNKISDMTALTGNCENLEVLDLSNNNLEELQFAQRCKMLRILNVTSNNLISFAGDELNPNIASLDLSHNNLSYIKSTDLSNLHKLIQLNLSRNSLFGERDMPLDLFQEQGLLQALNLSSTSIKKLSVGVFSQLRSLGVLDLSSNNLTYLPNAIFHDLESLSELCLRDNRLSYYQYYGPALRKVDLSGNLWNCNSLSSAIKRLKVKALRGSSYNTTNVYGITCYEELKDLGKVDTYNSSDVSDPQKEYLSHLIRTQTDLRETFAQLKTFLAQSDQNGKNFSMNGRIDAALLKLNGILNETNLNLQRYGNSIKQQQFYEENMLGNLTNVLESLPKLANVLIALKNETNFREILEANNDNAIKQLIMELKDIILRLNNNFLSTNTDISVSSMKSFQAMQAEALKAYTSTTTNKGDTIALYFLVVIQLAIFGLFIIKHYRRYRKPRTVRDENNPLNSLVV